MNEVFEIKTKHGLVAMHWNFVCAIRYDNDQPFVYINYNNGIQFNLEFDATSKHSAAEVAKHVYEILLEDWQKKLIGMPTTL